MIIRKRNWERFYTTRTVNIFESIFGENDDISISRNDIFNEPYKEKKVLETIMWGYPKGWPQRTMRSVTNNLDSIISSLSSGNIDCILETKNRIPYLGWSTLTKLLYFFDLKINGYQCLILDRVVRRATQVYCEFDGTNMTRLDFNTYLSYIQILKKQADNLKVNPDQIELYLFNEGRNNNERLP